MKQTMMQQLPINLGYCYPSEKATQNDPTSVQHQIKIMLSILVD